MIIVLNNILPYKLLTMLEISRADAKKGKVIMKERKIIFIIPFTRQHLVHRLFAV